MRNYTKMLLRLTGLLVLFVSIRKCATECPGKTMLKVGGISCQEKQLIIDEHNRLRNMVAVGQVFGQPQAANMMEMAWDDELANVAQRWSEKCRAAHDYARNVRRFAVGQNIAITWTTRKPGYYDFFPDWKTQIEAWFNEVKLYRRGFGGAAHYTQIVWGETFLVGCGYSFYYDPGRGYTKNYVCNYGPSGNVQGYQPYISGPVSCQSYGYSNSNKYTALCVPRVYNSLGAYCYNQV